MNRYTPEELESYAIRLLVAAGLSDALAPHVARNLAAADLLGHTSHGFALLPRYIDEIVDGRTARSGAPECVRDNGSSLLIDGCRLPGAAVVDAVLDIMLERLADHGAVIAVVRRSQHIGCLSAYLERATSLGFLILIASSNPHAKIVAPFGGVRPTYSPNPLACGIPTIGDPILIDTSMSSVSVNRCREHRERGEQLGADYLYDSQGRASRDPAVLFAQPPGAIKPFGGDDLGFKGFALGLMIEALTSGLGGYGRIDSPADSSNAAFILIADPAALGGGNFLMREMTALMEACKASATAPDTVVRLPGERAAAYRREVRRIGIPLPDAVTKALAARASALGVTSGFANRPHKLQGN